MNCNDVSSNLKMNSDDFTNKLETLQKGSNSSICHRQTLGQRLADRRIAIVTKAMNESKSRLAKQREKRMDRRATRKSGNSDESMKVYLEVLQSTQLDRLGDRFDMLGFSCENVGSNSVATSIYSDTEDAPEYPELTTANSGTDIKYVESTSSTNRFREDISDDDLDENEQSAAVKNVPESNTKNRNIYITGDEGEHDD